MPLLDRVKERIETDLGDVELQAMIDAVTAEIERRYGPQGEITNTIQGDRDVYGGGRYITLWRPLDEAQPVTVVEIERDDSETQLDAADWRVLHGGRTLERLATGPNARSGWQNTVRITYTPISDQPQREEAIIQVVQLEIQARGLMGERAGDWQAQYPDLAETREKLIATLAPRRGLAVA